VQTSNQLSKAQLNPGFQALIPAILFTLLALILRLWQLDAKSIWLDEAFSAYHSTFSAYELWTQPISNKPPLYYLITKLFWSPGNGEFALRLPSAIIGALSVFIAWLLGREIGGSWSANALALLVLISDINLHYSQEARQYILLSLGWLLVMLSLLRLVVKSPEQPGAIWPELLLAAAGAFIMVHTTLLGFMYLIPALIAYTGILFAQNKFTKTLGLYPILVMLLAGTSILPWLPTGLSNAAETFNWVRQPKPLLAFFEFMSMFGAKNLVHLGGKELAIGAGICLVLISLAGILHFILRVNQSRGFLLLGFLLLPPLLIWLVGFIKPIYLVRTITPVHLPALIGFILTANMFRTSFGRGLLLSGISLILMTSAAGYFMFYAKEDWRGLSNKLKSKIQHRDAVIICEKYLYWPMWFYLNEKMPPVLYLNLAKGKLWLKNSAAVTWQAYSLSPGHKPPATIWEAGRFRYCISDGHPALSHYTGGYYARAQGFTGKAGALKLTPYHKINLDSLSPTKP